MPQAEPHASRGVHSDDLDPDAVPEIAEQAVRDRVRSARVFQQERGSFSDFLRFQSGDGLVREGLRTRRTARREDRGEKTQELDARRSRHHSAEIALGP